MFLGYVLILFFLLNLEVLECLDKTTYEIVCNPGCSAKYSCSHKAIQYVQTSLKDSLLGKQDSIINVWFYFENHCVFETTVFK